MRIMTEELFTKTLQEFTQRRPFVPFFVELVDGRRILIDYPAVAFSGGAAAFISEAEGVLWFRYPEVRAISQATAEASP
jgi:hypothetical protein